ncbi:MAG: RNA polymerase subunit sigma-70, partial [Terriglobales bacterium]
LRPGRFQWEAAIQSVHTERARTGRADWAAIAGFYEQIVRLAPTIGARAAWAAAAAEADGPAAGLARLETIPAKAIAGYQPYWAVRGHLLGQLGRRQEAQVAYGIAIRLSKDPALREHLKSKSCSLARHSSRGPS